METAPKTPSEKMSPASPLTSWAGGKGPLIGGAKRDERRAVVRLNAHTHALVRRYVSATGARPSGARMALVAPNRCTCKCDGGPGEKDDDDSDGEVLGLQYLL